VNLKNKILSYFQKYPINGLIMLCANGSLSQKQVFLLLKKIKDKEHYQIAFSLLRDNKNIDNSTKEKYLYNEKQIQYYKNEKLIDDHNFFKDRSFIDSLNFSEHSVIEYNMFVNWDIDYLMSRLDILQLYELAKNKYFRWSIAFIDKYQYLFNDLVWNDISDRHDIEWSKEFLDKYKNNWNWSKIARNEHIPFSEELVIYFVEKWNESLPVGCNRWGFLLQNNSVQWTYNLYVFYLSQKEEKFKYNFDYDAFEYLRKNKGVVWSYNWLELEDYYMSKKYSIATFLKIKIPWTISILYSYKERLNWSVFSAREDIPIESLFYFADLLDWKILSKNESLNWREYLIHQFETYIDFKALSTNASVKWNSQLLDTYKDKLDWSALAMNKGVIWNNFLLEEFKDKISFYSLTESSYFIWSVEVLIKYKKLWNSQCDYRKWLGYRNRIKYEDYFIPAEICKNPNVIFSIDYLLEQLPKWDEKWFEFTYTKNQNELVELNGEFYDVDNEIWKELSANNNLSKELIIFFKNFWDYKTLIQNKNIVWDIDLIMQLEENLIFSDKKFFIINLWENNSVYNVFAEHISSDDLIQNII